MVLSVSIIVISKIESYRIQPYADTVERTLEYRLKRPPIAAPKSLQNPDSDEVILGLGPKKKISIRNNQKAKVSTEKMVQISTQDENETMDQSERIIFIKTHKTASSTMQNIFYRYALGTMNFKNLHHKQNVLFFRHPCTILLTAQESSGDSSFEGHQKLVALPKDKGKWLLGETFQRKNLQQELQPGIQGFF